MVISALQVEKHPLTTPGPYSTPPLPRHPLSKKHSLITMTPPPMNRFEAPTSSRTASPIPARPASSCASASYGSPRVGEGFRCSPKPHSSPKMKLRFEQIQNQPQNINSIINIIKISSSHINHSTNKTPPLTHTLHSLCVFMYFVFSLFVLYVFNICFIYSPKNSIAFSSDFRFFFVCVH